VDQLFKKLIPFRKLSLLSRYFKIFLLLTKSSRTLAVLLNLILRRLPSKEFWTWEVYGLGHATKHSLGVSRHQTLKCGSDHGVLLQTEPSPEEILLGSDLFVTWSSWRANLKFPDGRAVVQMQHPWISYRKMLGFRTPRIGQSEGTLAFAPHSVPDLEDEGFKLKEYLYELRSLPAEFHPISICFHVHDLSIKNLLLTLQMGFRVETVGASLSPLYTRYFYKMIDNFKFATSPIIGSHLFYCHEYGLKYFLHDPSRQFQRKLVSYGGPVAAPEIQARIESLFTIQGISENMEEKDAIVSEALGLFLPEPASSDILVSFKKHGVLKLRRFLRK
jgi:hypothetical protein